MLARPAPILSCRPVTVKKLDQRTISCARIFGVQTLPIDFDELAGYYKLLGRRPVAGPHDNRIAIGSLTFKVVETLSGQPGSNLGRGRCVDAGKLQTHDNEQAYEQRREQNLEAFPCHLHFSPMTL